ncbi:MAG: diguanylate cyclase [Gammaproteobacteria bacterium]|nr:diguanylate cyclase [Gammaproteobacteria bacterium]
MEATDWDRSGPSNEEYEQLLAVVDALPDPVFILTESGRYAGIAGGKDTRFYHDGSHLVGHTLNEMLPASKAEWFLQQIQLTLEEACLRTVEYTLGGEEVEGLDTDKGPAGMLWFEGRIQPLKSLYDNERAVVWVARNITERYELENKLRDLSEIDELTSVYNRRKILGVLESCYKEFRHNQTPTSLMMIDLDNFKNINDHFGHIAGDKILVYVARQFESVLRDTDLIARYGGDEFVVLLPNSSLEQSMNIAERLRESISINQDTPVEDVSGISISIGLSEFQDTDANEDSLLKRADEALYKAKHTGKDRVIASDLYDLI